ncbi:MAG: TIGR01777 family protein [Gemmatimonadetes bacterium]|nr:TIGR01777 family protein [Gemmatimonadota bacterium]
MHLFLTGATGFIGTALVRALLARGDHCTVISRSGRNPWNDPRVRIVRADPSAAGQWQQQVSGAEAVVNLAGERIVDPPRRWTSARKALLRRSRVETTRQLVAALREASPRPAVFVSGSAIGYYGARGADILAESATPGRDYLARLARDWEAAALEARDLMPVAVVRTGIVLGTGGGALQPLLPLFRLGLGGPWGDGRQWWSWIHITDAIGIILFAIEHRSSGALNLTAPNPVTVAEFAATLGRTLGRPAVVQAPAFALKLAMGEAADTLLATQRVVPARALAEGYVFQFPDLAPALANLLR